MRALVKLFGLLMLLAAPGKADSERLQLISMYRLVGINDSHNLRPRLIEIGVLRRTQVGIKGLVDGPQENNVCQWNGITCDGGAVVGIRWGYAQALIGWCIEWFPITVIRVHIFRVKIYTELDTRQLPPRLEQCNIFDCRLCGEIELRTLPVGLQELDLSKNRFVGVVRLTNLPEKLTVVRLYGNKFNQAIIVNQQLPHGLDRIFVGKMKLICLDADDVDPRIQFIEQVE